MRIAFLGTPDFSVPSLAALVEDGVVKVLNLEEGGAFTVSSAQDILGKL